MIDRCPAFYLNDFDAGFAVSLYSWLEKGFLPYQGGWFEQPNKIVEICEFMQRLIGYKNQMEIEAVRGPK